MFDQRHRGVPDSAGGGAFSAPRRIGGTDRIGSCGVGNPGYAAYAASKGAVRSMGRVLGGELAPKGVRVNVVVPGATRTPIWSRLTQNPDALATMEPRMVRAVPSGRISEAEEIANTILFLASDEATNIQSAEFVVDGGLTGAPSAAPIYQG